MYYSYVLFRVQISFYVAVTDDNKMEAQSHKKKIPKNTKNASFFSDFNVIVALIFHNRNDKRTNTFFFYDITLIYYQKA